MFTLIVAAATAVGGFVGGVERRRITDTAVSFGKAIRSEASRIGTAAGVAARAAAQAYKQQQ